MCNRRVHKPNNSKWKSGRFLDTLSSGIVYCFFFLFFLSLFRGFSVCPGRSGNRKGERNKRGGGCYAALPPSSSTLQHNSTRTQTFNFERRNCKCQFFFLQSNIRDKYIPDVPEAYRVSLRPQILRQIDYSSGAKVDARSTKENPLAKSQRRHNFGTILVQS